MQIGRLQSVDQVDVRPLPLVEELPRVDRQRLDILPLPLGKERVQGQTALARTAGPGDHDQAVAGDVEVDILQVVHARPADADRLGPGRSGSEVSDLGG